MRRNKRKKRAVRLGGLVLLIVVLAGFMMLFQVRTVNVYGNSRHAAEEISDGLLDGFLMKNTLYLQWKYRNGTIPDTLPFLDSIKVQMKSPFEVRVDVSERDPVAYVNKGSNAYFDENGLVLAITDEVYDGVPVVTGADVDTPVLYQKISIASNEQLLAILSITQLLKYQGLEAQEIRFDENGDITVYIGKVTAILGKNEYMEEKIANLRAILNKIDNANGVLHLESFPSKDIVYKPSDEPETETETESDTSGDTGGDDTSAAGDAGTGSDSSTAGDATVGNDADDSGAASSDDNADDNGAASSDDNVDGSQDQAGDSSATISMVFDSSGTLVYNVHVENGTVVDANGNPVSGCSVDSDGYVVDAYMNRFDPDTGELVQ
ncbi:MAG: cell division protein FtsQ/DivIB [Lachnospiraceae bacterium]|nr:cell division protein FtsQ/DivIB [Lachnospiraceae bacterium]